MMTLCFILLIIAAYLLGALPLSYLAARKSKGIDLRKYGTGQVGAGNLFRTTSWKLGLPIAIFDIAKGALMVWLAYTIGLSAFQQLVIGAGAVIGHNWSVFLRFSGGRGIGTTGGIILIVPLLNGFTLWGIVAFIIVALLGLLIMRSSPVGVLVGIALIPVISRLAGDPILVTLGYLALFFILIIKRVTAPLSAEARTIGRTELLVNRFFFDRDIRDKQGWMYRKPQEGKTGSPP